MKKLVFLFMVISAFNVYAQKSDSIHSGFPPEPKIRLKNWDKPYLVARDFENGSELVVISRDSSDCKVISYSFGVIVNGFYEDVRVESNKFSGKALELFKLVRNEGKVFFEDIVVQYSNGTTVNAKELAFTKVSDEFIPFVKLAINDNPLIEDFGVFKSDIRIQIVGKPTDNDIKIVQELIDKVKPLLESVTIKRVNYAPNLILEFQHDLNPNMTDITGMHGFIKTPFFPKLVRKYLTFKNTDYQNEIMNKHMIVSTIMHELAQFQDRDDVRWVKTSIIGCDTIISSFDSQLIKMLYSKNGRTELKDILNIPNLKLADNTLLILILSILIFIAVVELNSKFHFLYFIESINNNIFKRLIISILIIQIPLLIIFILKFLNSGISSTHYFKLEIFFGLFACLTGFFLLGMDYINNKIKTLGLNLLIDIILTTISFLISYQILLLMVTPEILKPGMLQLQWLYIPLSIVGYRFYHKYSQKRLSGIIKEKELEIAKQKEVVLKSELLSMQSRINPHFLYNALNSIASLVHISIDKTEEMTLALAKLFRYNINKSGEIYSTIAQEIEMVKIYLDVELVRFSDRMKYTIEVEKDIENLTIPVFLLQPLVENAIKYGISKLTGQGLIKLKIFIENNLLIISVYDNGQEFPADIKANYGLQSIFDKLTLLYKENFSVHFINSPEKYIMIKIKN